MIERSEHNGICLKRTQYKADSRHKLWNGMHELSRFSTRWNIPRAAESLLFFIEFRQKRTLKSQIKFNFSAAENSANQSYCSLCVPRDQNNSRSLRMISSSGKPDLRSNSHREISIKRTGFSHQRAPL